MVEEIDFEKSSFLKLSHVTLTLTSDVWTFLPGLLGHLRSQEMT